MKISFASIILLVAFAMFFAVAVSAESADQITNPTLKDLQGHWQGTTRYDGGSRLTTTVNMTFSGSKAKYSTDRASGTFNVTINGEIIDITSLSGRDSRTCKLSKASGTLVLNCQVSLQANPQANISHAMSGTMRIEKDK